jgi:RHS repeat-associated protein/uncharacterized repeat protein (TIGR01451 family)
MRRHHAVRSNSCVRRLSRALTLVLPAVLAAALLPSQAMPAAASAAAARAAAVAPLGPQYPPPMPQPANASAHLAASGTALDPRFAAPSGRGPALSGQGSKCTNTPAARGASRVGARSVSDESRLPHQSPPAQQSCTSARTSTADQGYKQARNAGKVGTPSPDWKAVDPAQSPQARYGAATVYDGGRQQVVVFGGSDTETDTVYSSTWSWNGKSWRDLTGSLSTAPSARAFAQAAYDPVRKQVVLFGGAGPGGSSALGDTWAWDGSNWRRLSPASAPPARFEGMMAWDPDLGKVVLYGGLGDGGHRVLGDSWAWDGGTWSELHPSGSPGSVFGAAMTYDDTHHGLLLFGGSSEAAGLSGAGDVTWSFDGRSWRQLRPSSRPRGRIGAGMAYDTALGKIVLSMGTTLGPAAQDLNDTWTWDGSTWSQLSGIAAPAPRQDLGLAYDSAAGQVLMVGGSFGPGGRPGAITYSDTNALGVGAPTLTESVDKGANGLYPSGGTARYTLTVGNSGLLSTLAVTVQDQLPASMAVASAPISILDVGTGAVVGCGGVSVTCSTANNALSITGLVIGILDSFTITFSPVVAGLGRACSTATDKAIASSPLGGSSPPVSIPVTICDTGLGVENWWTFINRDVGPQAQAQVNVSNGNLVVQQTDSTPIQAHGHLAYVLNRTYNSQDTALLSFPGSFGAGWNLDIAETGDLAGSGVGATGLFVPPVSSVLNPLAVTLIDADGTRHVFGFRGLNATIDITGLLGLGGGGPLADLVPQVLSLDTSRFNHLCVDETFSSPAGVHLGLYRYIEVHSGNAITPCSVPDPGTSPVVLGFATVNPQRVRNEFSFDGHLLDILDSSGTDLRYRYAAEPLAGVALGPLQSIFEPRSCGLPLASTCRAFRFSYGSGETDVTDPAGRVTRYLFDNTPLTPRLVKVVNPDGSQVSYAYQVNAFSGVDCGGSANQLCSITDNRGNTSRFTYQAPLIGLSRLTSLTDRRGTTTTLTYHTSPDFVTADTAGHRSRFQNIDDSGRVAEIDEGDTSDNVLHQTLNTWDTAAATCQQPDHVVNNNLCRQVKRSLTTPTPDQDMTYVYNPEGRMLHQHWASPVLDATSGFHAQYFQADGSVKTFDDTVHGSGQVSSDGPGTGRGDAATLFAISDPTQSLSPRGNAAGSGFAPFLTTYKVDDNPGVKPNAIPASNPCANPGSPTSNTGDLCEVDAPSFDGGTHPTVTRYTYDTFGAKLTMTTPKAIADTPSGQAVPATVYTYYQDSDRDLSGNVSAGGWLKAITDPTGNFVAFAYDRAGNMVRTWDRNATQGHQLADFPGSVGAPPSGAFTEILYGSGSGAYSAPWRYVLTQRDPLGNRTTYTLDQDGNQTVVRPPRGNAAGNTGFDVTRTFDQNNNQLSTLMPLEAGTNKATTYTYDPFNNRTSTTDPDGNVTTSQYDNVNRQIGTAFTRGGWPGDTSQVPPACRQSTSGDAPIPAGRILCSSAVSYDGVDNRLSTTDANHQVTTYAYDGMRRQVSKSVPRNDGTLTTLRTDMAYDPDGHVTDTCPPREFTEGASTSCTASGFFSQHRTYDVAGRLTSSTTFRGVGGAADTTSFTYDADGNPLSTTDPNRHVTTTAYDLLDRRTGLTRQRDASTFNTTTTNYDPAGNVTAVIQPGNRITAYSHDAANRLIDTVKGADNVSAPAAGLVAADGGSNVRTRTVYDADGHVVASFEASAFAASTSNPDPAFMVRTDIDQDGRISAVFQPRYDAGTHSDLGLSGIQAAQCATNPSPQPVNGVPGFPAGVGVCVTRYQYDAAGNQIRTVLPTSNGTDNKFVVYAYTDDRLLASVDAPSPAQDAARVTAATYLYDGNGKQVKQTDALGHQKTTTYTSDELVAQQQAQPNGAVTHVTRHGYDANGNHTSTVDAVGNKTTTDYYADNLTQDVIDAAGDTTRYVYDPAGNLAQKFSPSAVAKDKTTNPQGVPITDTYTFDNLVATSTQAVSPGNAPLVMQRTIYGYDAGGRKTSQQVVLLDAQGQQPRDGGTQHFDYYNNDLLKLETGRLSPAETISHAYDPNGNQTAVHDSTSGGSTISSTFYLDNLPRSVDDGSRTTQYTHDGLGQQAAMANQVDGTSTRSTTTYTYSDAELTAAMSSSIVGSGRTTFGYDAAGRLSQEQDPNNQNTAYTFNPDDTLAVKALTDPAGASVARFSYTYDGDYRTASQTFTGQGGKQGNQAYTYDPAGRLSSFTEGVNPTQNVTWDHDGNRLTFGNTGTATYNPDDTLASTTDSSGITHPQIYSFRGDLTNDGCFIHTYDGFDRVTSVTPTGSGGCSSTPAATYAYDGLDRQRSTGTTALHYDGTSSLVSVVTNSPGTDTAYELTPDGLAKAVAVQAPAAGPAQFLGDDGQGNITTITTASGALACSVRYDPWGSPLGAQSPANPCDAGSTINDHFYRGQRLDPVTGSYQLGSRTYQPSKASFLNPDTYRTAPSDKDLSVQADPLTQNRYSYVNGDPVNLVDPDGHKLCRPNDPSDFCDAFRGNPMTPEEVQHINDVHSPAPVQYGPFVPKQHPKPPNRSCAWWDAPCRLSQLPSETQKFLDEHAAELAALASLAFHAGSELAAERSEELKAQGQQVRTAAAKAAQELDSQIYRGRWKFWVPILRRITKERNADLAARASEALQKGEAEAEPLLKGARNLRLLGRGMLGLGTTLSGYSAYQEDLNSPENKLTGDERTGHALLIGGYTAGFSTAGAAAGIFCGPAAIPCALAGGWGGEQLGKRVGGIAYDAGQASAKREREEGIPIVSPY